MEIMEVTRQSPWGQIADMTTLLIEQMKVIGKDLDEKHVKAGMENALKPGTTARFFICYDDDEKAAACCLLNIGSGIEAGGDYIWINEFHVREDKRRMGFGQALLKHVLQWANEEGYDYIASVTSPENKAARELFKQNGFGDSEMIWLERTR